MQNNLSNNQNEKLLMKYFTLAFSYRVFKISMHFIFTAQLNFTLQVLNSHMWLVATILGHSFRAQERILEIMLCDFLILQVRL